VNDTVIGIITDKAAEAYRVNIGGRCAAVLLLLLLLLLLLRVCVCVFV
jgi:exosome complex RNA-binding protein Rrp4